MRKLLGALFLATLGLLLIWTLIEGTGAWPAIKRAIDALSGGAGNVK